MFAYAVAFPDLLVRVRTILRNQLLRVCSPTSSDVILSDAIAFAQMEMLSSFLSSLLGRLARGSPGSGTGAEVWLELALFDMFPRGGDGREFLSPATPGDDVEGILNPPIGIIGTGVGTGP